MSEAWPWLALLGLGAFHGINPGMGWLFAVALGMQESRGAAVWRALLPLGLGRYFDFMVVSATVRTAKPSSVCTSEGSWPSTAASISSCPSRSSVGM